MNKRAGRFSQTELVFRADSEVGESPVWDRRTGHLCWVDIASGKLSEGDVATGTFSTTALSTMLGAAVPRAHYPGFGVAVSDGFGVVADGILDVRDCVLPEPHRRMNDAKCDSAGRLWAGSTRLDFADGGGALHRWSGGAPSEEVVAGLTLPNGIGWNLEDSIIYLIDSIQHRLLAAAYQPDEGEIGDLRELVVFEPEVLPDGLAVDVEGCIWVAIWGGAEVRRFSPSGELLGTVTLPVDQPSSCAFGGDGTLYITSARAGLSEAQLGAQPLAGSVFAVSTKTEGVPVHDFAG